MENAMKQSNTEQPRRPEGQALRERWEDVYKRQSWSIVQGESAYALLLYHNWSFSRDQAENARQMAALVQEIEQQYTDTDNMPISTEDAEIVMRAAERVYRFSWHIWKEHHTLLFLLPATHKTEDSFCRCYQRAGGKMQADIYLLVQMCIRDRL